LKQLGKKIIKTISKRLISLASMKRMNLNVRPETRKDNTKITEINDLAFGQKNEGTLVEKLRKTKRFIPGLSLVAEVDGEVVGHILFYPILIDAGKVKFESLALAPMSVHPEFQKRGIGSRMVKEGIKSAKEHGFSSVIVLGHPEYYPRFGFGPASRWDIHAPFDVPVEAFLAIELEKSSLSGVSGVVEYPQEFGEV
jgi:putative acetyltransferase